MSFLPGFVILLFRRLTSQIMTLVEGKELFVVTYFYRTQSVLMIQDTFDQ